MQFRTVPSLLLPLFALAAGCSDAVGPSVSAEAVPTFVAAEGGNGDPGAVAKDSAGGTVAGVDAAGGPDVAVGPDAPCVRTTCEDEGKDCGVIADGCDGVLDCGECAGAETCGGGGEDNVCGTGGACVPATCEGLGAECGSLKDGCGGELVCGDCPPGEACGVAGVANQCGTAECVPLSCDDAKAECGATGDGCGGTLECGECPPGLTCGVGGPNLCGCAMGTCGPGACGAMQDGCGGTIDCGGCPPGLVCKDNLCKCQPSCSGKQCGDDGCGGSCGGCADGAACNGGQCVAALCGGHCGSDQPASCGQKCECYCDDLCFQYGDCCDDVCATCAEILPGQCCKTDCAGKQCGDDGCGGSCGSCGPGSICEGGTCTVCEPQCAGKQCGPDGCGGNCGTCGPKDECQGGVCVVCQPECAGKQCGPDGCGGTCGSCPDGTSCAGDQQCKACVPDCKGMKCGDDGCGGTCGSCEVDCSNIPEGPFELVKLSGPIASEDLAFDDKGNVVGSNDKTIFKTPYGGSPQVFVPSIKYRAGMRYLPSGDLLVNNDNTGQLLRIEPNGTINVVLNNLKYPNGMAIDLKGYAYVTEHDANRVLRVEPYAKTMDVLSQGTIKNPNGICFNAEHTKLFVAGFSGVGTIYAFQVDENGDVGDPHPWATNVGTGWLDGIGVDICGNLYIADYYATKIYRFTPDGKSYKTVATGKPGSNTYLPNMQWGSGLGGWDRFKLYLPDGWNKGVFELDVGVPGGPVPYP